MWKRHPWIHFYARKASDGRPNDPKGLQIVQLRGSLFSEFFKLFHNPPSRLWQAEGRRIFICILIVYWLTLGSFWILSGSLWVPVGSFLDPFWVPMAPFGFLLAPLCHHLAHVWSLSDVPGPPVDSLGRFYIRFSNFRCLPILFLVFQSFFLQFNSFLVCLIPRFILSFVSAVFKCSRTRLQFVRYCLFLPYSCF